VDSRAVEKLEALDRLLGLEQDEARARADARREGKNDKALEADGVLLRAAVALESRGALMGRVRLRLGDDPSRPGHLATFAVRSGSVVYQRLKDDNGRALFGARGIVARRSPGRLEVVFDAPPSDADQIDLLRDDDDVTLGRLRKAVKGATGAKGRHAELVELLLGVRDPRPSRSGQLTLLDTELNDDQRLAVDKAVFSDDVSLVHGPPGTGKTRALVEIVRQFVGHGERVLALCASNAAVDHLALSLMKVDPALALARVGHPARVHEDLEARTLAGLTEDHELRKLARRLVEDAFSLLRNARKRSDRSRDGWRKEREARAEAGKLFADARRLERQAVEEVLRTTRVLCGTLTGFLGETPEEETFDVLVVDEASQALTPALLQGAARVGRIVLAGDHRQLPPTVLSLKAAEGGLSVTAFEGLREREDADSFSHLLTVQHRMHADLMGFPSERFYDGRLQAHASVAGHLLADLDLSPMTIVRPDTAFEFFDTAGAGYDEDAPEGTESRSNPGEADVVKKLVDDLLGAGLPPADLGVITPYSAHAALLGSLLADEVTAGLEVDSVDGFQGREKEVIVMSAVRSNTTGTVGFLSDPRRLNVSITRAKRKLIVIGDSATLGADSLWNAFVEHAIALGAHRSVFELG
jgi:ATP-dependent RNA/DNA helicase IGHMBP2